MRACGDCLGGCCSCRVTDRQRGERGSFDGVSWALTPRSAGTLSVRVEVGLIACSRRPVAHPKCSKPREESEMLSPTQQAPIAGLPRQGVQRGRHMHTASHHGSCHAHAAGRGGRRRAQRTYAHIRPSIIVIKSSTFASLPAGGCPCIPLRRARAFALLFVGSWASTRGCALVRLHLLVAGGPVAIDVVAAARLSVVHPDPFCMTCATCACSAPHVTWSSACP